MHSDNVLIELFEEITYIYRYEPKKPFSVKLLLSVTKKISPIFVFATISFILLVFTDYVYNELHQDHIISNGFIAIHLIPIYIWVTSKVILAIIHDDYGFKTEYIKWFDQHVAKPLTLILLELENQQLTDRTTYFTIENDSLHPILEMMSQTHYNIKATPNIGLLKDTIRQIKSSEHTGESVSKYHSNKINSNLEQARKMLEHLYMIK